MWRHQAYMHQLLIPQNTCSVMEDQKLMIFTPTVTIAGVDAIFALIAEIRDANAVVADGSDGFVEKNVNGSTVGLGATILVIIVAFMAVLELTVVM